MIIELLRYRESGFSVVSWCSLRSLVYLKIIPGFNTSVGKMVKGVIAPVFTPINEQRELNCNIIQEYVEFLSNNAVSGILVGGTTGEGVCLSLDERKTALANFSKAAKKHGLMVIAQIGGVPLPEVLEMARYAEEVRVDAIMTLPELYYKPKSPEQLVSYLRLVSNNAPSLPLIYYHFPMMSGVDINMRQFFSLAKSKIPNFKGMKADLGVATEIEDQLDEDQIIFIGNHILLPAVALGHDSSIATVTNLFPRLIIDLVESTKKGEIAKAKEMQKKLNKLVSVITSQGEFVPAMKAAMEIVTGIKVGSPRLPLEPITEENNAYLKDNLLKYFQN